MLYITSIQFIRGVDEIVIPKIHITTSADRSTGTAKFSFLNSRTINDKNIIDNFIYEIKGMYLIDNEGVIATRNVDIKFKNGKPETLIGLIIIKNEISWNRFLRFLKRYSFDHNLKYLFFSPST